MLEREIIEYRFGAGFRLDRKNRLVFFRDTRLPIEGKHFDILEFFLQRPWKSIAKRNVKPLDATNSSPRAPIDNYISELRDALGPEGRQLFKTIRGVGCRLECVVTQIFEADRDEANTLYRISSLNFNDHTTLSMRAALV